ncbi:hypothetical protein BDZ85DRAFT_263772 [Elsinoe ampelina]|uniref:Uncharacterized protein n=1 Tax=Elsinoe ampelina TaxID=302913 RepID=A0A6A6G9U6_9PEZI|nr:hypothetical protein BDZ85DRAFT_263772 [Elsinoe ampelina]
MAPTNTDLEFLKNLWVDAHDKTQSTRAALRLATRVSDEMQSKNSVATSSNDFDNEAFEQNEKKIAKLQKQLEEQIV